MRFTVVVITHDRRQSLLRTLAALGRLPAPAGARRRPPAAVEAAARSLDGPGRFTGAEGVGEH
jgi:hypothetical protein